MTILKPIERFLELAQEEQAAQTITQVVVMRSYKGIDSYLFRRATSDFNDPLLENNGYLYRAGDAWAPNWDNDGWPITDSGIDVVDISDYVEGFDFSADTSFAAASVNISIANMDGLFSPDCITFDNNKFLTGHVVSNFQSPRNALTGASVFNMPYTNADEYEFQFLPNYMTNRVTGNIDAAKFCPMFRENNIVKVREGYRNPYWNAALAYNHNDSSANKESWPIIWKDRFTGLVSAASAGVSGGGKMTLNVVCHDMMKLVTRATTERAYIPMLITNDANKDPQTGKVVTRDDNGNLYIPEYSSSPDDNKIFYNPYKTTGTLDDVSLGFSAVNFLKRKAESLLPQGEKVAIGRNVDWSNVPEPQIYIGGQVAMVDGGALKLMGTDGQPINNELNPDGNAEAMWANGFLVRWYDSYEPVGRPKKFECWNNMYFIQDMFADPNGGLSDGSSIDGGIGDTNSDGEDPGAQSKVSTHPFIGNNANWSFVADTMFDPYGSISPNEGALGPIMFCLYVEGSAKVYVDGALVASTQQPTTLADYLAYRTAKVGTVGTASTDFPVQPLQMAPVRSTPGLVQVAESGLLCWTIDLPLKPPDEGANTIPNKLYHIKIVYQCGSRQGYRNICALRWYGTTAAQRSALMQNALGMETVPANPLYRMYYAGDMFHIKPYNEQGKPTAFEPGYINDKFSMQLFGKEATLNFQNASDIEKKIGWMFLRNNGTLMSTTWNENGSAYLSQPYYFRQNKDGHKDTAPYNNGTVTGDKTTLWTDSGGTKLNVGDPQWFDAAVIKQYSIDYRTPVMGHPVDHKVFRAFLPIRPDDPDFGFDVLYSRGGIEFKTPILEFGKNIAPEESKHMFVGPGYTEGDARYVRLGAQAKYVYKSQADSRTVDDILTDLVIQDGFGVDRFSDRLHWSAASTSGLPESPLYGRFKYGWKESGANGVVTFLPKASFGQTQQVPDNIMFNLENAANTHEAMRKMLDVLQSNYFVFCNARGQIRGKFQTQDGLPRLIPPAPPAIQPRIEDREFYCMTLVGNNKTLDLPKDVESITPLQEFRESTFLGEITLDRITNIVDVSPLGTFRKPLDNPYPADTNVMFPTFNANESNFPTGYIRKPRTIVFQPVLLNIPSNDPNSPSIDGRNVTERDTIKYYWLYRRQWDDPWNVWRWHRLKIECNDDGTPIAKTFPDGQARNSNNQIVDSNVTAYRYAYRPIRDLDVYNNFYVVEIDVNGWESCAPPPSGQYDPYELLGEATRTGESGTAVRPLIVGYDYRIDAMESLALPRDDFNIASRVLIHGQKNANSMPDLVADHRTRVLFHGDLDSETVPEATSSTFLPAKFTEGSVIKDALTQFSFNGASKTGFTVGWYLHSHNSSIVNSASTIYLVDEDITSHSGSHGVSVRMYDNPNQPGSDPWPPYKKDQGAWGDPFEPYLDYNYDDENEGWFHSENNYGSNNDPVPGDWATKGPGMSINGPTWTDFKYNPNQSNPGIRQFDENGPPGWPHMTNPMFKVGAKRMPKSNTGTGLEYGWYTAEGKAEGYYTWVAAENQTRQVYDRVRGGFLENVAFSFVDSITPNDEGVKHISEAGWNWSSYRELFTLDFGREIDLGEVGMAVGYAPYEVNFTKPGLARISLTQNTMYHRWLAQTNPGPLGTFLEGDAAVQLLDVYGFAGPVVNDEAFYDSEGTDSWKYNKGRFASLANWYINERRARDGKYTFPWIAADSDFKVVHEYGRATSVGTGAALCEFFLEMKLGRKSYKEDGGTVINWQTIATDQRVQTQSSFWKWDENFFRNMPTKGQYLKIRIRMPSPTTYVGFLTRNHTHKPLKFNVSGTTSHEDLQMTIIDVRKSKKGNVKGGSYRVLRKEQAPGKYKFYYGVASGSDENAKADGTVIAYKLRESAGGGFFYAEDPVIDWSDTEYVVIDGKRGGIVTFTLDGPSPTNSYQYGAATLNRYFEIEGTRNIGNMLPMYQGVNILPSFAAVTPFDGMKAMRLTPWFGALPAVYHSLAFVSIQKLYAFEKKQIKANWILRPSTGETEMNPLSNIWYDPKIDRANDPDTNQTKFSYRAASIPKRSMTKRHDHFSLEDNDLPDLHHYNHRSVFVNDPSAYTEGRAKTIAFQKLQEVKQPMQAGNLSVVYFPELFVYQTVLVNEACITGYMKKPNGDAVEHFGRTFLIEKLNVSNRSGKVSTSVTLKDYHNG